MHLDTLSPASKKCFEQYLSCRIVLLDGRGRVSALAPSEPVSFPEPLEPGKPLPKPIAGLMPGQRLIWEGEWFVQAEKPGGVRMLILRPLRAADGILGPYGENHVNEEMVRLLLDNPYEGLTVINSEGEITMMSPSNETWFGLAAGGAAGLNLSELSPNSRLTEVAQTGVPVHAQVVDLHGQTKVTVNLPLKQGRGVIGAVGRILFQSPEQVEELAGRVQKVERRVEQYETLLNDMRGYPYGLDDIITKDVKMMALKRQARRFANARASILILGESGTGKELFAQALHNTSRRRKKPFVAINCAAIPQELIESELFGYEEGAFTGARGKGKPGKIELASEGTLFLDEIGDLSADNQAKLLRVLEDRKIERLGQTTKPVAVDFRLIAATNRDLENMVKKGSFRSDLYYRINEIPLDLPPLRERRQDIPLMAEHFLTSICREERLPRRAISRAAMDLLVNHPWPGNVRELRSIMKRLAWQAPGMTINPEHLPEIFGSKTSPAIPGGLEEQMAILEHSIIETALKAADGNKALAARMLGIHRTALYKKMNRFSGKT